MSMANEHEHEHEHERDDKLASQPPPERADHAVNPSATPPSHRAVARRRLRSPMLLEDVLCRFPYDLFACAGRGAPFAFGAGHIARLLLLRRAWAIVANRFESLERRRFVGSGTRLAMLGGVSLVGLHLYACVTWLVSASLAALRKLPISACMSA